MSISLPMEVSNGLDEIIYKLNESKYLKGYRYFVGNPNGAHLKDFDDSSWNYSAGTHVKYRRHQGISWFRLNITVPENILDIPVEGAQIRLLSGFMAPVDTFVDGELRFSEKVVMDYKVPEVHLTESAAPGQVFQVAIRLDLGETCYFDNEFYMNYVIDRVDDIEFQIRSFKEELVFACRFAEVQDILPKVFQVILDSLNSGEGVLSLVERIQFCRELLRPMEVEAKKNVIHLVGHAHIDMNWFWTIDDTLDVIHRDFDTMTNIMQEIPEFTFSQSQCVTYEMAEMYYPEIFERLKKYILAGNWDVTAAMWVEADMNLVCGESIIRQVLYAKKYLKEKFGIEPRIFWCPDTFGHSANIPQIAKKSGIDYYFFTRCGKVSTEYGAELDYFLKYGPEKPVFWWEGLDGSRILAYNMAYSSEMSAARCFNFSIKLRDAYGLKNSMFVYGVGDHGGGPTRRDIRRAKQLNSYPTTPKMEFSTTHRYFDAIIEENSPQIPVVKDELNYMWTGCYTTHADIKKSNRESETLLVSAEILGTIAGIYDLEYPKEQIEQCWKTTLFNQFHDILDGTSIKATYRDCLMQSGEVLRLLDEVVDKSLNVIGTKVKRERQGIPYLVFNTTGWQRKEYVKIGDLGHYITNCNAYDDDGEVPAQVVGTDIYVFVKGIPPAGYKVIYIEASETENEYQKIKEAEGIYDIETNYYYVQIKKNSGEIITLFDKLNNRYVVRPEAIYWRIKNGVLNTLQMHYEVPTTMSSWTIGDIKQVKNLISGAVSCIKADGPEVKIINIKHNFDNSEISQDIILYNRSPRIDFVTHVNWNEYGDADKVAPMLRVSFTPDVNPNHATCEIPFGVMERPCKDTEIPALRWVDISDGEYGFGLLNNCKYGHRIKGNIVELSLIRSGWEPDPTSDVGFHDFTYSILPHKGDWKISSIVKEGSFLNNKLFTLRLDGNGDGSLPGSGSYMEIDKENVAIAAFKPAESENALILRLYETEGTATCVHVKPGFNLKWVEEVDLNENKSYGVMDVKDNGFSFNIGNFDIRTFKLFR